MAVPTPRLSKSKITAGLQCKRRLWLETYRREAVNVDEEAQAVFDIGNEVGALARILFGPGELVEHVDNLDLALAATETLLARRPRRTLFEAAFRHDGVLVRADILQPVARGYDLIEVKSSTEVKDYHLNDCAIQAWVIENAGLPLRRILLAHVNNQFVYKGDGNYAGLLVTEDITKAVRERMTKVPGWVRSFKRVLKGAEPDIKTGTQCHDPFECPCYAYCKVREPAGPRYPIDILPHPGQLLVALQDEGYVDLCKVPADRLKSLKHQRIRTASISGKPFFDPQVADRVNDIAYPRYYLDFETVAFAVPRWAGTRPYQQLPFQWSCHIEGEDGSLEHDMFLDLSGEAPMRAFAESLCAKLGRRGQILVYNAAFERTRIKELAAMFPRLATCLGTLESRIVDLLPITREHSYHPAMMGSWSIKKVIPTIAPELDYDKLGDVASSGDAPRAYLEAVDASTSSVRRKELDTALRTYCAQDTLAMLRLVKAFAKGKYVAPRRRRGTH